MERTASPAEQRVCERLRELLPRFENGALPEFDKCSLGFFSGLEWFITEVLCEVIQEWKYEGLDGIYPTIMRKTGSRSIEVLGSAILITDSTFVALAIRLQLSREFDHVSWCDCRLGLRNADGSLLRVPYDQAGKYGGITSNALNRLEDKDWFYHVGYGEFDTHQP